MVNRLFIRVSLQLFFHADNGVGRFTAVDEEAGLCDGQWHSVSAHKLKHRLELIVDGRKSEAASPDVRSASADTNDPVYVGGYPGTSIMVSRLRTEALELIDVTFLQAVTLLLVLLNTLRVMTAVLGTADVCLNSIFQYQMC